MIQNNKKLHLFCKVRKKIGCNKQNVVIKYQAMHNNEFSVIIIPYSRCLEYLLPFSFRSNG